MGRPFGHKSRTPSGSWRIEVERGARADGSRRRIVETLPTEQDADARLAELAAEFGRRPNMARGVTLSAWWDYYQRTKGARLARATLKRYAATMAGAWLPALGGADVSLISRADVQAVLLAAPTNSAGHERRRVLSAVLGQAVADGVLDVNPCAGSAFEYPGDVGASVPVDYSHDPFAAIEGAADVWTPSQVLDAMPRIAGAALEPAWLVMVGAGLRLEEALALTWNDVRRVDVGGRPVVQVAVWRARTRADGVKRTKGTRSVRVMAVSEPFASRLWSLRGDAGAYVCGVSAGNVGRAWRRMWTPPKDSPNVPRSTPMMRGRMLMPDGSPAVPYLPISRMRATHETMAQAAGVLDSVNAATHGHSRAVSYRHYMRPVSNDVAAAVSALFDG